MQAVAKAIHVPVRRREEQVTQPSMAMKAAAVNLAVVLRRNFDFKVGAPGTAPRTHAACSIHQLRRAPHNLGR